MKINRDTYIGLGSVLALISILFSGQFWIDKKVSSEVKSIEVRLDRKVEKELYNMEKKHINAIMDERFKVIQEDINEIKEILKEKR